MAFTPYGQFPPGSGLGFRTLYCRTEKLGQVLNNNLTSASCLRLTRFSKATETSPTRKLFLINLYLKTEGCIRLKLLV